MNANLAQTPTEPKVEETTLSPASGTTIPQAGNEPTPEPAADPAPTDPAPAESDPTPAEPLTIESFDLPENFDTESPLVEPFLEMINSGDLTPQNVGQKVLELAGQFQENQLKMWAETQAGWVEEITKDPTVGGQALEANLSFVSKAISNYTAAVAPNSEAAPEIEKGIREAFTLTGAGNNPHIVKFLVWMGKQLGEGGTVNGDPAAGAERSRAETLFGSN